MTYLELDLILDAGALSDEGITYIEGQRPGWQAAPGHIETLLLEAVGFIASQLAAMTGRVPITIFQFIGRSMLHIDPIGATSATATTVWTMVDTVGYTVPAGTLVSIAGVAFELPGDLVVPAASPTGTADVVAVEPGAAASGLSAPVDVLDRLTFVDHVAVTGVSTGGTDGETDVEYVDRVATLTPTLSPKAILSDDFELLAATVPGVDLALAIRNYIPAGPGGSPPEQTGVGGAVTVALRDAAGQPVTTDATNAVDALLDSPNQRIAGIVLSLIDATYTTIDATFSLDVLPDWDPTTTRAQAIAALADGLSPANHGVATSGERRRRWRDEPQVRYNDLIGALYRVEGTRHVDTLGVGFHRTATIDAATDVVTSTAHGYSDGDPVIFTSLTGGAGLTTATTYYVRDSTTDTFKVAATAGGAAIDVTTDATAAGLFRPGTADLTLPGPAGLPQPGTITGTTS